MWAFSPSSEPLLKRCLEIAGEEDKNNKWVRVFKHGRYEKEKTKKNEHKSTKVTQSIVTICLDEEIEYTAPEFSVNDKFLCEVVETDLQSKFPFIIQECTRNTSLLAVISNNINDASVEKFCNQIYTNSETLQENFVNSFLQTFLPIIIKKGQSWFTLDMLVRASKSFPKQFKSLLLPIILKDTLISNNILHDFLQTLTVKEKCDYLNIISENKLTAEQFLHHLPSLNVLYKDCEHSACVKSFITANIGDHADYCCNDKNFGRLLLAYIQSFTEKPTNVSFLEQIVENHRSPFKRPCLIKLKSLQ